MLSAVSILLEALLLISLKLVWAQSLKLVWAQEESEVHLRNMTAVEAWLGR